MKAQPPITTMLLSIPPGLSRALSKGGWSEPSVGSEPLLYEALRALRGIEKL